MQEDTHIFQGMKRATHPIKQDKNFLWDAHNIRLTTRGQETMLSITNERSTRHLIDFNETDKYVGHVVLGNYLVVLVHSAENDIIYRIDLKLMKRAILYKGSLNLDPSHPAQMIADYESELVQKVYWVDGINSPRVINIAKPRLSGTEKDTDAADTDYSSVYSDSPFGFVQDLELNEEVTISRLQSSVGIFPTGVIQYALTYLHKYGQESNVFYVSEPLYLSYADRGGSPEDRVSTSFRIDIKNVDKKFQYVRVYSIIRTSIDSVPVVKRVADVDIAKSNTTGDNVDQVNVSVVDNNTTGDNVDPTYLLYVGGKDITAKCIASKDNTLFLGNIAYNRKSIRDLSIKGASLKIDPAITLNIVNRIIPLPAQDVDYMYSNQLSKSTLTFKNGETYRLGCRFQYKSGEWSEPVWVDDKEYKYKPGYDGSSLRLGQIEGTLPEALKAKLINEGYKKVQALIVQPSYRDRTVIAQGILCPTVGQVGNRIQGGGAWAQSSWLLRPWSSRSEGDGYLGAIPACQHNESLPFGADRDVELQSMAVMLNEGNQMSYDDMISGEGKTDSDGKPGASESFYGAFVVDQSIVTMHSPDIEFGDIINLLSSEVSLELYKVGKVKFSKNKGEIDIQTETPVADPDAGGFLKRSLSGDGARSLISGLFYEDAMVDDSDGGKKIDRYKTPKLWMTYMWHRTGSLNNDCVRPEGVGTRTSVLKKKSITNLKVSNLTSFDNTPTQLGVTDIKSFNSNEVALVRLKRKDGTTDKSATYYGNVDTLVPAYIQYSYMCTASSAANLKNDSAEFSGQVFVGGEQKTFSGLKVSGAKGANTFIQAGGPDGGTVTGKLPYIVETVTTITNTTSTSSSSSSSASGGSSGEDESGNDTSNDSSTSSDSSTSVVSEGTKTVMVTVTGKARINLNINSGKFSGTVTLLEDVTADDGKTIVPAQFSWSISGETSYQPQVKKYSHTWLGTGSKHPRWSSVTPLFTSATSTIDGASGEGGGVEGAENIGDNYEALKLSKDGVRMKYKSTPHAVISLDNPLTSLDNGELYLVELRQDPGELRYGGNSEEALRNNLWIPAGPALNISEGKIKWVWGDTWFQRYDCLKTYPFTFEDINQVTEIGSFYCETRVNIDGRYDRNRGSTSFSLSPINFNLINPVYSQLDNFFTSRMLDDGYYKVTDYPSQFLWTGAKIPASDTDLWTNLHMASSYDMDGSNGTLTAIQPYNDLLLGFQDRAVSQILFNSRVQIQASDGVPIEIANSQKVEGVRVFSNAIGCQDKFNIVPSAAGIYFIDNNNSTVYRFNGELNNLGLQLGNLFWFRENFQNNTWMFKSDAEGNPGVRLFYDPKYQDVYFVPSLTKDGNDRAAINDSLCFSEQLDQFTSMMSYNGAVMFPFESKFYSLANNPDGTLALWENFAGTNYNNIFGTIRPFNFSFVSNDNPTYTKIFDTVEMRTDRYDGEALMGDTYSTNVQSGQPLDFIRVNNEYQDTQEVKFTAANLRKKFRVWRATIPRNGGTRERIRNPWSKVTLGCNNPSDKLTILHDLSVKYTI